MKEVVNDVKKGLDSDNGSKFKNKQLLGWCAENHIKFTRRCPYRKNDSVVRRIAGYYRLEGEDARNVMAELYEVYNKLVNYFFPSMKIISKER